MPKDTDLPKERFTTRWARLKAERTTTTATADPEPLTDANQPPRRGTAQRAQRQSSPDPMEQGTSATSEIDEAPIPMDPISMDVSMDEASQTAPQTLDTETSEPLLTDADMPPISTLDADSDYSGFFSPGVSEDLRKLALRKLFSSPVFNVRDGLDDYDQDFTRFTPLGDMVTADMKYHQARLARLEAEKAREAALLEESNASAATPDTAQSPEHEADEPRPSDADGEPEALAQDTQAEKPLTQPSDDEAARDENGPPPDQAAMSDADSKYREAGHRKLRREPADGPPAPTVDDASA